MTPARGNRWAVAAALALLLAAPASGEARIRVVNHYTTRDGLAADWIRDVLVTEEGLWLATAKAGLCYLEENGSVRTYNHANAGFPSNRFTSIVSFRGRIYAGGEGGLMVFDGESWQVLDRIDKTSMRNVLVAVDPEKDELWAEAVNVAGGLLRFDGEKWHFFGGRGKGLVNNVTAIAFQGETLWLGTRGAGIYKITAGRWELIRAKEGLRDSAITALAADGEALWIGTNAAGLGRLEEGSWRWVAAEDGLGSDSIRSVAVVGDLVFVGTEEGLYAMEKGEFSPEEVDLSGEEGPLRITRIRKDREPERIWVATTRGLYQLAVE